MDHRLIPDPLIGGREWILPRAPDEHFANILRTFCASHLSFFSSFGTKSHHIKIMAAMLPTDLG